MNEPLPPFSDQAKNLTIGFYKHYKGLQMRVIGVGRHSETLEELVMYQHVDDGNYWVRPVAMFYENVEHHGEQKPRFRFLHD